LEVAEKEGVKVSQIILFGSRAKGQARPDSDWDILVVVDGALSRDERKHLWFAFYSELHKKIPGKSFDLIVQNKEKFEAEKQIVNTLSNEAYLEGVRL